MNPKTVFVGQGPNRSAWTNGIARGRFFTAARLSLPESDPRIELPAIGWAERYCERLAITGRVGERLADLLGMHRLDFYCRFGRRNLTARWHGKNGKGDAFDRAEGEAAAAKINAEGFDNHVLLGGEVARCFGWKYEPLVVREKPDCPRRYLIFPHPSGINTFWNDPEDVARARAALVGFINTRNP